MKETDLIEYAKENLKRFTKRLDLNNVGSIRRFLNTLYLLFDLDHENSRKFISGHKKELYNKMDTFQENFLNNKNLESLLFLLDEAKREGDYGLEGTTLKILEKSKTSYLQNTQNVKKYGTEQYEDIVFKDFYKSIILRNTISLRSFYYALKYKYYLGELNDKNLGLIIKTFLKNYYIDSQNKFTLYPSFRSKITTISPSRASINKTDYWAYRIYEVLKLLKHKNSKIESISKILVDRAFLFLSSYYEDLDVRDYTFRPLYILYNEDKKKIQKIAKVLIDFEYLDVDSYNTYQILKFLNLEWNDVEVINLSGTSDKLEKIKTLLDLLKNFKTFDQSYLNFLLNLYQNTCNEQKVDLFKRALELFKITSKDKNLRLITYYAAISSQRNAITVPTEFFYQKTNVNLYLSYLFLKILTDQFPNLKIILRIYSGFMEKTTFLKFRRIPYFIRNSLIENYLNELIQFSRDYYKGRPDYEGTHYDGVIKEVKFLLKNLDVAEYNLDEYKGGYVVYPNNLVKLNIEENSVKGFRLTIAFRDPWFQDKISMIKDMFSNYYEKVRYFAESNYNIFQQMGRPDGQKEKVGFIKNLYRKGFKYILKADIKKCTDCIEHNPLREVIKETLPNHFSKVINTIATEYTIEFEDKRVEPIRGIAQGNPLSTELYIYIMSILLIIAIKDSEININDIAIVAYGDDITILAKSLENISLLFEAMIQIFAKFGWQFEKEKCI